MAFKLPLRFAMRCCLACLAILALAAAASAEPYKIVGFGDSLMAGYGLDPGQSFPGKA